jgi:hypothetical protein
LGNIWILPFFSRKLPLQNSTLYLLFPYYYTDYHNRASLGSFSLTQRLDQIRVTYFHSFSRSFRGVMFLLFFGLYSMQV